MQKERMEYIIIVAHAFYEGVTRASLNEAIAAAMEGDKKSAFILLS